MAESTIYVGDCRAWLQWLAWCGGPFVDAIVTDPPYELGFMGRAWDRAGAAFDPKTWRRCLDVAKPGAHLLAFGGTRTYHRMTCAIEDAGWEIRDCLEWIYASGFPKSLNVSKAIDARAGAEREVIGSQRLTGNAAVETKDKGGTYGVGVGTADPKEIPITAPATADAKRWAGWGTALKPAHEPIVLARKPLDGTVAANVLRWGVGGVNVDGCRVGWASDGDKAAAASAAAAQRLCHDEPGRVMGGIGETGFKNPRASVAPYLESMQAGRWPPNVILDGHAAAELDTQSGDRPGMSGGGKHAPDYPGGMFGGIDSEHTARGDSGGASRFFPVFRYCPKADRAERERGCERLPPRTGAEATSSKDGQARLNSPRTGAGRSASQIRNHHPTVKPVELMRWLVRLVAPPGGLVLDPFAGSGTTGVACALEGVHFLGLELEPEHVDIARARIAHVTGQRFEPATDREMVEPRQRELFA